MAGANRAGDRAAFSCAEIGQIAFDSGDVEGCPFHCNVEVMNGDGSGRHVVARGYLPAWSPDGSRLAYWGPVANSSLSRLMVLDLRTGKRQQFLRVYDPAVPAPAWSPDGSRLAFVAQGGRGPVLRVVTLSDGQVTRLASLRSRLWSYYFAPEAVAWSPDGRSIVYTDPAGELASVPATGGSPSVLRGPDDRSSCRQRRDDPVDDAADRSR